MFRSKIGKVAVAISGGVDSSVAAALLVEQGYDVVGVHMVCFDEDVPYCTAFEDKEFAIRVAARLDIPLKIYDFRKEYKERVIDYMVREYQENRTPNPDVVCNREIKFGLLFEKVVEELGVDYLATGHYAWISSGCHSELEAKNLEVLGSNVEKQGSFTNVQDEVKNCQDDVKGCYLMTGKDPGKDQSYFLYSLTSRQLSRLIFPLGDLMKEEVRSLAAKYSLPTQARPDSQGLCFIGQVDVAEFLADKVDSVPGEVVTSGGRVVGSHRGLPFYTIGQRRGFELEEYFENVMYVVGKIPEKNQLIVGPKPQLKVKQLNVLIDNWIKPPGLSEDNPGGWHCGVRIRHLGEIYSCSITVSSRAPSKEPLHESGWDLSASPSFSVEMTVELDKPIEAVAPGQIAVFYDGERVLGGGVIGGSMVVRCS